MPGSERQGYMCAAGSQSCRLSLIKKNLPLDLVGEDSRTRYLFVHQSRVIDSTILPKDGASPIASRTEVKVALSTLWALIGTHYDGLPACTKDSSVSTLITAIATMN